MAEQSIASVELSQQSLQNALVSLMATPMANAWELLDTNDPSTMTNYMIAVAALTRKFGNVSGTQAALSYMRLRKASGIKGTFRVGSAPPASIDKIETSLRWATKDLWQPNPDVQSVKSLVSDVTEKNVLDTGRETILNAVRSDSKAKGWARETEPGCCSFCALLATRGAVYRSDETASFESHDHCRCFAVPVFTAYEPTAQIREWQQLYKESTKGVHGSAAMRNAFRQSYEAKYKVPS